MKKVLCTTFDILLQLTNIFEFAGEPALLHPLRQQVTTIIRMKLLFTEGTQSFSPLENVS